MCGCPKNRYYTNSRVHCYGYIILSRQSDIISMVLRMDDVELLDLAFGFVRGCYNQQIKKEQEAENNGEV